MPSTYSPDLRIELIGNGEQSGTWSTTTNTNLGTLIEDAISGLASVSVTFANQALTALNGTSDEARCAAVRLTTTTGNNFAVYVPPVTKLYLIQNASSFIATVYASTVIGNTTAAGAGIAVPAGKSALLRVDTTSSPTINVVEQLDYLGALSLGTPLPVSSGGTGAATLTGVVKGNGTSAFTAGTVSLTSEVSGSLPIANGGTGATNATTARTNLGLGSIATQDANNVAITGGSITGITDLAVADGGTGSSTLAANNVLLGNGTSALQTVAPGSSGNVLTSNGTTWVSGTAFVTGMIMMWSGTIATIPSGWALCNGTSGTPDLRNRFIVGASVDSGGQSVTTITGGNTKTGGSKDAITVSHTHTFSTTTSNAGSHSHLFYWSGVSGSNPWPDVDNNSASSSPASGSTSVAGDHNHSVSGTTNSTGSSGTDANLTPYYALAFIMKL